MAGIDPAHRPGGTCVRPLLLRVPACVELPADVPIAEGADLLGRGGSAIVAPNGEYLAGPLWDEEGILFADLDPQLLYEERQRFDPAGHYSRPDVLQLRVQPITRAAAKPE